VAILGIAGGAMMLAQQGMYFSQNPWSSRLSSIGRGDWFVLYLVANAIEVGASLLLIISSINLFQWKPWARVGLIIWAAIEVVAGLLMIGFYTMYYTTYVARLPASTQPTMSTQQIVISLLGGIFATFYRQMFPLAVAWIMLQREVKAIWSGPRSGGFDVIPIAQAVQAPPAR
jgi:hypothetical protein